MLKFFLILFYVFIPWYAFADDICSKYKFDTDINVNNITKYNPVIKSSKENLVGKLGYIEYQTEYTAEFLLIPIKVKNGYCVSLRSIDININVPEFTINIDKRLKPNTCAYDIVLSHEQDHMNANKKVITENINDIKIAVKNAADSVEPVFISNINESEDIQQKIHEKINSYKSVKDIKQKIKSNINNIDTEIDTRGDSFEIWKCKDFYKEMKKFGDTITID